MNGLPKKWPRAGVKTGALAALPPKRLNAEWLCHRPGKLYPAHAEAEDNPPCQIDPTQVRANIALKARLMGEKLDKSFEHRKRWVENRILELGDIFACGIYAWAVVSNLIPLKTITKLTRRAIIANRQLGRLRLALPPDIGAGNDERVSAGNWRILAGQ